MLQRFNSQCHANLSSTITITNRIEGIAQKTPNRATSVDIMAAVTVDCSEDGVHPSEDKGVDSMAMVVVDCSEHGVQPIVWGQL